MGVVHHASYVPWLEIGRTELLRGSGTSYAALEAAGVLLVIVKLDVRYRRSARYDDLVEITTRWVGGSRVKLLHEYEVRVLEPGTPTHDFAPFTAVAASTTLACVDRSGSVIELPSWLVHGRD